MRKLLVIALMAGALHALSQQEFIIQQVCKGYWNQFGLRDPTQLPLCFVNPGDGAIVALVSTLFQQVCDLTPLDLQDQIKTLLSSIENLSRQIPSDNWSCAKGTSEFMSIYLAMQFEFFGKKDFTDYIINHPLLARKTSCQLSTLFQQQNYVELGYQAALFYRGAMAWYIEKDSKAESLEKLTTVNDYLRTQSSSELLQKQQYSLETGQQMPEVLSIYQQNTQASSPQRNNNLRTDQQYQAIDNDHFQDVTLTAEMLQLYLNGFYQQSGFPNPKLIIPCFNTFGVNQLQLVFTAISQYYDLLCKFSQESLIEAAQLLNQTYQEFPLSLQLCLKTSSDVKNIKHFYGLPQNKPQLIEYTQQNPVIFKDSICEVKNLYSNSQYQIAGEKYALLLQKMLNINEQDKKNIELKISINLE